MSAAHLRPLLGDDAPDVLSAFAADSEMSRQGDVTDLESAEAYIRQLTDRGRCVGVVAINGSHQHQLGWFFYWVHPDTRGRGVMSQAAAGFLHEGLEREKFEVGGERVNVLTYGRLRSDLPAVVAHLPMRYQQDVS